MCVPPKKNHFSHPWVMGWGVFLPPGLPNFSSVPQLSPCPRHHPVMPGRETSLLLPQNPSQPPPPPFWSRGGSALGLAQSPDHRYPPKSPFPWPGACPGTRLPTLPPPPPQKDPRCLRPFFPLPLVHPTGQASSPGASWRPKPHKSKLGRSIVSNILCKKVFPGSTEGWRILLRGTLLIIRSQPNVLQPFFIPGPKPDYFPPSADLPFLKGKKKKRKKVRKKKIALMFAQQLLKRTLFPGLMLLCRGLGGAGSRGGVFPSTAPREDYCWW